MNHFRTVQVISERLVKGISSNNFWVPNKKGTVSKGLAKTILRKKKNYEDSEIIDQH